MPKGAMPRSPQKANLQAQATALPPLERKSREKIGQGDQSLILANDHNSVLIITKYRFAKKIELLRQKVSMDTRSHFLTIPTLAGMDIDLASLMDPLKPEKAKNIFKGSINVIPRELWTENVVYQMTRFVGTLEDCRSTLRYKEDSIDCLEQYLHNVITLLHEHNLTHNDICLKNIFYSGTYPHLQFHLGDFGSLTENLTKEHERKSINDHKKIQRVIEQLKQFLNKKRNVVAGKSDMAREELPYFALRRAQKLGVSPLKTQLMISQSEKSGKQDSKIVAPKMLKFVTPKKLNFC